MGRLSLVMKVAGCFGLGLRGCIMHHASCMNPSERINREPRRRSAELTLMIRSPVLIPHNNVPSRTNDSMAFTRFTRCNDLFSQSFTKRIWARLTCVQNGRIRVRSCDLVTCMDRYN